MFQLQSNLITITTEDEQMIREESLMALKALERKTEECIYEIEKKKDESIQEIVQEIETKKEESIQDKDYNRKTNGKLLSYFTFN